MSEEYITDFSLDDDIIILFPFLLVNIVNIISLSIYLFIIYTKRRCSVW